MKLPTDDTFFKDSGDQPINTFSLTYIGLKQYFDRLMKWDSSRILPAIVPQDFGTRKVHEYTLRALEFAQTIRIMMF
jgi:hypothetical protein